MSYLRFSDDVCLVCPNCDSICLHAARVDVYDRKEDAIVGRHVSVSPAGGDVVVNGDMAGNPSQRRDGICVEFWCEGCSANPVLAIVQHKGTTRMEWL